MSCFEALQIDSAETRTRLGIGSDDLYRTFFFFFFCMENFSKPQWESCTFFFLILFLLSDRSLSWKLQNTFVHFIPRV